MWAARPHYSRLHANYSFKPKPLRGTIAKTGSLGRFGLTQVLALMKSLAILLALTSSSLSAEEAPKPPFDLLKSDADLVRHIQATDHIFASALGRCSNGKIERGVEGLSKTFVYTAACAIKPLSDTPCPAYSVMATGSVDGPHFATVNSITLALLCPGQ